MSREPRSGMAAAAPAGGAGSLSEGGSLALAARSSRQGQQPCRGSRLSHPLVRGPAAAPALQLVLFCLLLECGPAASAAHLPSCRPVFTNGEFTIPSDCVWPEQETVPAKRVIIQAVQTPGAWGNLPAVNLAVDADTGPAADFSLTLKRLVLRKMALAPALGAGGLPRLLPLGLFHDVPRVLSLYDVRMVVDDKVFAEYLTFFRSQLRSSRDAAPGPSIVTDNSSVLNVPYWSDNTTEVFSLTFLSGPCNIPNADTLPWNGSLQQFPAIPGCSMRTADNKTLVQTLQRDAGINTTQPLLIRLVQNVTLGPGITQSIPIRRPIVLLGMVSAPTSVDLAMVVNQLNVTLPYGKITWQSVALENLAPGDALSSTVAAPFSATVSSNVWAMFCNRSASSCVNLNNVTLVVPAQEELNYQVFMYTMFNSPAPALRDLTEFYRTELSTQTIQFVPGPGNDTLTVIRLLSTGWDFWYVTTTLRPFFAPLRPMPRQAMVMQRYRAGALVYALQDCQGFVTALASKSTSTRTRVWTLTTNVSIAENGHMQCSWPDGNVTYPTQLLGALVHTYGPTTRMHDNGAVASPLSPEAIVLGHADANTNRNGTASSDPYLPYDVAKASTNAGPVHPPTYQELYSLSFGYVPSLFQLPVNAQDKFLQIQNLTLQQLPQMASSRTLRGMLRRRLQADASPIGIWTLLLWPFRRTMYGVPVTISDSQLFIPQPEWDALANEARQAPSFAMQLQSQVGGLTFTGVSLWSDDTLRVGAFQGPGVTGSNLWLRPDPEAAQLPGYSWPSELFAVPSASSASSSGGGGGHSASAALRAGIGVAAGVLGVLAVCLAVVLLRLRKRHAHGSHSDPGLGGKPVGNDAALIAIHADQHGPGTNGKYHGKPALLGHEGVADTDRCHDTGIAAASAAAAAAVAVGTAAASRNGSQRQPSDEVASQRSSNSTCTPSAEQSDSECEALVQTGKVQRHKREQQGAADSNSNSRSQSTVEQTIAHGLERWNAAVSQTTLQLMQRRLQNNNALYGSVGGGSGSGTGCSTASQKQHPQQERRQESPPKLQAVPRADSAAAAAAAGVAPGDGDLQLHSVIGTGSFGSVWLGSWRGKRVAVKVMHLQNNTLLGCSDQSGCHSQDGQQEQQEPEQQEQLQRLQRQREQNSPPHMAVMEAVVSSAMSHPNVVQVYTYMLTPLMVQAGHTTAGGELQQTAATSVVGPGENGQSSGLFGYSLKLVMEWCEKGTLREALDRRRLPRLSGTSFPHPSVAFSVSHDVAAAMLHLHSEGVVHGDLKAGNVLLTATATPGDSSSCSEHFARSTEAWISAGSQPLSAKVADFGMAMPLGPQDTHATMLARGTPTHMSPELFMAGHVSKASDVYAYGILLYELITGQRAYAGVPVPLLPHEVALQGLRPEWPRNMPAESSMLRDLAEACWQHKPQDRPGFNKIMHILSGACPVPQQAAQQPQQAAEQQDQAAAGEPGRVVYSPVLVERKASREQQMDWSEISYGDSKHDGGWS